MLTEIHIHNLATIEELHLELSKGTTVITGETGAGKSIIMDAIDLALGGRASAHMIRAGQDKMDIRLCFDLDQEYIVRRVINRDGRSRCYLNDMPLTLPALRQLSETLIDIHGQHEHQSLLKLDKQRELLDRFGNHQELCQKIRGLSEQTRQLIETIDFHQSSNKQRDERREFLRFQVNELEALQLQPKEWQGLETEHKQLANADSLLQNLTLALSELSQAEDKNALSLVHRALKALECVKHVNPQIAQWSATAHSLAIQMDDLSSELSHYQDSLELNPERLQWVEQRMQAIHELARKYKVTPLELPALITRLSEELATLEINESSLEELKQQLEDLKGQYLIVAEQLHEKRSKAGKKLAKEITNTVKTLALPHAEFQVELVKEASPSFSPHGIDKISYLVKTNRGAEFHPLNKVASGGELSRISLAIQLATAEQYTVPTLIFDEVDVGIGGSTAELVGKLIRRLGKTHQVLCITHLPQVAACGNHHLSVEKTDKNEQTYTQIRPLSLTDKVKEIARMLGGVNITSTTLKHAEEMLGCVEAS